MKTPSQTDVCPCIDAHLEELFAAAGAIGLLSAQVEEPDIERVSDLALKFGKTMAAKARRGRKPAR